MSDKTILAAVLTVLVLLSSGVALGVGGIGTIQGDAADVPAQETTTQEMQEQETTQAQETTQEPTETAGGQANETQTGENGAQTGENETQTGEGQAATNVAARNVTVERLVLRNVTVRNAQFDTLTVLNATGGENATNETYGGVSAQRIDVSGEASDLTLTNVTLRNESLADALINETGRQNVQTRLIMDMAVLSNQTVNGLVVENATVAAETIENVSVETSEQAQTADGEQTQRQPAVSAETAVVEEINLTNFEATGLSLGETTQAEPGAETTTVTETTAVVQTTTAAAGETTTTTTIPAEAGNRTISEGETTTQSEGSN